MRLRQKSRLRFHSSQIDAQHSTQLLKIARFLVRKPETLEEVVLRLAKSVCELKGVAGAC